MSKTLQTVYVPNKETHQEFLMYLKSKGELQETQAYLYTEQEHQAAQGYSDALERIQSISPSKSRQWQIASEALSAVPTTQTNGWISVEDELPLTNKNVLIFSNDRGIGEATKGRRNIEGRYFTVCGMQLFEVTHWQPLPLKPQP